MKKIKLLILVLFFFGAVSLKAQVQQFNKTSGKNNIVKLNVSALLINNVELQYERRISKKFSLACAVRVMPKSSLPWQQVANIYRKDSFNLNDLKISSFTVTPEARVYFGRALKGMYLSVYARIRNCNLEVPVNYVDADHISQTVFVNGKISSMVGGLMLGSQFRLSKSFTLDWYLIGVQYGFSKVNLNLATSQALSSSDQNQIRDYLDKNNSDYLHYDYDLNADGLSLRSKFGMLGFRGLGVCLGYRFGGHTQQKIVETKKPL